MSKTTFRPRNEFRYNNYTRHPNYVFGEDDNSYHSLGITHEKYTFGRKNMPLAQNPKRGDKSKAYIRNGVIRRNKKYYGRILTDYSFSSEDKAKIKSKIRQYKKRNRHKKR